MVNKKQTINDRIKMPIKDQLNEAVGEISLLNKQLVELATKFNAADNEAQTARASVSNINSQLNIQREANLKVMKQYRKIVECINLHRLKIHDMCIEINVHRELQYLKVRDVNFYNVDLPNQSDLEDEKEEGSVDGVDNEGKSVKECGKTK